VKPPPFDYVAPSTAGEAVSVLAAAGGEAQVLAGGQSLMPELNFRTRRPAVLVDINRIAALQGIAASEAGIAIKAATRQADVLADAVIQHRLPLLAKGLRLVGHPQTRNRGTIGGSLANADPAAEICLIARTLDAEITARSSQATRRIAMRDFCAGAMTTALAAEECLTEVRFPLWRDASRIGTGFNEMSVRQSDFALVAAACQLVLDHDGVCRRIALGIGGAEASPVRAAAAEKRLTGTRLEAGDIDKAMGELQATLSPLSDVHASADYRRRVAGALAARAIAEARDEAKAAA